MSEETQPHPPMAAPALLDAALDELPVAAIVSEAGPVMTRVVLANRRFADLLGWTVDELLGTDTVSSGLYVGPLGIAEMASTLDAAGELLHYVTQLRTKDGGVRRVTCSTRLFEHDGDKYAVSTCVPVDDDELEHALSESEGRLQAILDAIPFAFAVVEADGRVRMANERLCQMMGRTASELLGHDIDDVFPRQSARGTRSYLERMAAGADLEIHEIRFAAPAGELWFRTSCFPLRRTSGPRAGQPYAACVLAVEVTDEHLAQAALRESDTRFRQVVSSIDDAFVLWGGDPPQVLYASPRLATLYGVDDIGAIPTDDGVLDRTTHPDDAALRWQMYTTRIHSDEDLDYEYRIIHPDGAVRWIRVRSSRVRTDGQVTDRVATMLSDVTERKQAELELQAAWAAAEEANQRKNDFLSRMSHELRTPLNAILGFTQLLELDDLTGDQRSNLAHVGRAGRHLLELINDVLDVTRIESGELRLSIEGVDLTGAVLETVAMMRPQMEGSDVRLDLPVDAPSVTVIADRQRLIQVLLNLLTNAVKYNRPGGSARIRWAASAEQRVRFEVTDTGIGMAPGDLDRLFTPFERFAPQIQGTGIGLVLTRQLIEAMAGTLTVESVLGAGTTVTVELPGPSVTGPVPDGDDAVGDDGVTRPARVLCVEADGADVELLRRTLDLLPDCDLLVAGSGHDALGQASEHRPDLVLLDLHLPDQTGEAVLRQLRGLDATAGVAVIVMATEVTAAQRATLAELGVTRVLAKPYKLSQLLDGVEAALGR